MICPECNKKLVRRDLGWVCNSKSCVNYWRSFPFTIFKFDTGKMVKWKMCPVEE